MRENDLLASIPRIFSAGDPSVIVGSGPDDCAHIRADSTRLALSIDSFAEGSHFLPGENPRAVARKSLLASLSDLAASACRARWALVSLCLKKGLPEAWAAEFSAALAETAREYGISIIGGDIVAARDGVFVSVAVAGEPLPGGPVLRGGGKAGDFLVVTGDLGGSIRGKHLAPVPRFEEMTALMRFCAGLGGGEDMPHAAMDISDGLALDLSRLCGESGTGAVVREELIPVSAAARAAAAESGRRPLEHALFDGEDFELLLAVSGAVWEKFKIFLASPDAPCGLSSFTHIGELTATTGLEIIDAGGSVHPLDAQGYQHRW